MVIGPLTSGPFRFGGIPARRIDPLDECSFQPSADRSQGFVSTTVLIVDDDLGTRETFDQTLSSFGITVHLAGSGAEAVRAAQSTTFDLLLIDWDLPDVRGTDLVRVLQADSADVPFVLMSAFLTTEITVEAMRLGARNVIEKPISIDDLPALVRSAIQRAPLSRATNVPHEWHPDMTCATAPMPFAETGRVGSAAERWAMYALKGCRSTGDFKTLEQWAARAGVSYTSLRHSCQLLGMRPYDARDLVRVLRAVIFSSVYRCLPEALLDVSDPRTLETLLDKAGLKSATAGTLPSVDRFFREQQFIPAQNAGLRLLHSLLLAQTSPS